MTFHSPLNTYGHAMGDEVLKSFCQTVQSTLRQSDIFGRIGGEEFCICVQNTSLEGVLILAEKIRKKVESTQGILNNTKLPAITVSIGISSLHSNDHEIFDTIKRSDEALYKAKHNGRNQVQIV